MKSLATTLTVLSVLVLSGPPVTPLDAQEDPDYAFTLSDGVGPPNGTATIGIEIVNNLDPIQGFQFGVCPDEELTLAEGDASSTADLDPGSSFTFLAITLQDPNGFTVGALLNVVTGDTIDAEETPLDAFSITYGLPEAEGDYVVEFCDTLGDPTVTTVVVVDGVDIAPEQNSGTISVVPAGFTFELPVTSVEYRTNDGLTADDEMVTVTVSPSIDEDDDAEGFPNPTQGFSMGIAVDDSILTVTDFAPAGAVADLNDGTGPEFFGVNLSASDLGVTVGCVFSVADETIVFEDASSVADLSFEAITDELIDNEVGAVIPLAFDSTLGSPMVRNTVVVAGFSQDVLLVDGSIELVAVIGTPFVRGDCNDTGNIDLTDGIFLLASLFEEGGPARNCDAACNMNGDTEFPDVEPAGILGIADAIFIFEYLFLEGPIPPEPFPDCAPSEQDDEQDRCEVFNSCE